MSVPAPLRNPSKLKAQLAADDMVMHTVTIISNPKVFSRQFDAILSRILDISLDASQSVWEANNIRVRNNPTRWNRRHEKQLHAMDCFDRLLTLARISRQLFHLRGSKYSAWVDKICIAKEDTKKWIKSDVKRYGHLSS